MSNEIVNLSIVEEAKELMGDRFSTLVKYFFEDTEMYFAEIEQGIKDRNPNTALAASHTIKSSAKQLGAERVSEVSKQIEYLCRDLVDSDTKLQKAASDKIYNELQELFQELKEEIDAAAPLLEELSDE